MKIYQWKSNLLEVQLSSSAKLIGFVLSEFYREGKECFPSITLLTEVSGLGSKNTTIKALKELERFNLITINKKRMLNNSRESNIYIFNGIDIVPSNELSYVPSNELSLSIPEVTETTKVTKSNTMNKYIEDCFEEFWTHYPKKRAGSKNKALQSYKKVLKEKRCTIDKLFSSVKDYAKSDEVKKGFAKGCSAWLNDDRFNNTYTPTKENNYPDASDIIRKLGEK